MKPENKIPVVGQLSPVFRQILDYQNGLPPVPLPAGDGYFPAMRRAYAIERQHWNRGGPALYAIEEDTVATQYGPIDTRIYRPHATTLATIFYLHGGGFIVGNLDTHDRIMRLLAEYTGCTVIGINYSLSPEAKYPQAIEETVAVCQHYYAHPGAQQLNMANIGFAGDSAGAMLSLACALWLRDHHIVCGKVCGLLLWYGLYGLEDSSTRRLYGGPWDGLGPEDLRGYEMAYLREEQDRESPWYCLFNNDLTRDVPPCFIAGAEFDPLLDDSLTLYHTLNSHGQRARYCLYSGMLHGFLHYSRILPAADNALRDGADYFRQQLSSHQ